MSFCILCNRLRIGNGLKQIICHTILRLCYINAIRLILNVLCSIRCLNRINETSVLSEEGVIFGFSIASLDLLLWMASESDMGIILKSEGD